MACQIVILTLVLFAIVGFSASMAPTNSPSSAPSNDVIGNTDSGSGDDDEAGPIGGPVPEGVFPETPEEAPVGSPNSSVGAIKVVTAAGVAATVAAVFF